MFHCTVLPGFFGTSCRKAGRTVRVDRTRICSARTMVVGKSTCVLITNTNCRVIVLFNRITNIVKLSFLPRENGVPPEASPGNSTTW